MMIVNNNLPVKNVAELIAYAKKNPGKLAFASDGNGTTDAPGGGAVQVHDRHLHAARAVQGSDAGMTDLIGGGVQVMMVNTPVVGPHAQAGRVRALGISVAAALADLPRRARHRRDACPASR